MAIFHFEIHRVLNDPDHIMALMNVFFATTYVSTYSFPSVNTCVSVETCPHWDRASSIAWSNIPASLYAHFFEDSECRGSTGFHFSSGHRPTGSHAFKNFQAIKSIMLTADGLPSIPRRTIKPQCTARHENMELDGNNSAPSTSPESLEWAYADGSSYDWYNHFPNRSR